MRTSFRTGETDLRPVRQRADGRDRVGEPLFKLADAPPQGGDGGRRIGIDHMGPWPLVGFARGGRRLAHGPGEMPDEHAGNAGEEDRDDRLFVHGHHYITLSDVCKQCCISPPDGVQ